MTTKILQNEITTEILSIDGDKSISISQLGLTLTRDILTTPIQTIITPLDITDVNTGNVITMDRLTYLPIGLAALTVPTDGLTCNFNDAIQLQDYNTTLAPPLSHTEVKIGGNPLGVFGIVHTTTEPNAFTISGDNTISLISNNENIELTSPSLGNIVLDAPNINTYNYATPICFTRERTDTFTYTLGGQNYENVYTTGFNIPYQFVADSPISGYTSTHWKIDFGLNCWNCTATGDKGLALYIVFQDQSLNFYSPITYNALTPYAVWQNSSTFNNGTNSQFQNFNWVDYVDLVGLTGTGSGNLPLNMILVFAGDSGFSCNFSINISLTRTNLI